MKKRFLPLLLVLALCLSLCSELSLSALAAGDKIGDVDGNGIVEETDLVLLTRYLNGWPSVGIKTDPADIDRNGRVENRDRVILARYLHGWTGYDSYFTVIEETENKLTIVKEPLDVEMTAQSAVLSITVSGEFDTITYEWQKQTPDGWRDAATLNSDKVTYTINNSALHIASADGKEGFGEYRCIVTAFNEEYLVDRVTSRTAVVDPTPAPLTALLGEPTTNTSPHYYYFYHEIHDTGLPLPDDNERTIKEQPLARILKNYSTQERFQYMITPQQLFYDESDYLASGERYFYSEDGFFDVTSTTEQTPSVHQDENGDWWAIPAARFNTYECTIGAVSGGKGPYTYTWYLSKDRFGNDFNPLIEGYNCYGQGTEHILVWPFEPDKGREEPYLMGFLCCRVTDAKGRTANACYWRQGTHGAIYTYAMIYTMDENNLWFTQPRSSHPPFLWDDHLSGHPVTGRWW